MRSSPNTPVPRRLVYEDEAVLTSARTTQCALESIQRTWEGIEYSINLMPANALVVFIENVARMLFQNPELDISGLKVGFVSYSRRKIPVYWQDVIEHLVFDLLEDPEKMPELTRQVVNHYTAAENRALFHGKLEAVLK